MSEEQLEVQTLWQPSFQRVHPAIGVLNGDKPRAYVGVWIPSSITLKGKSTEREALHFITSDHKAIPATPKNLKELKIELALKPIRLHERWPLPDVQNYCNLEGDPDPIDPVEVYRAVSRPYEEYIEFPVHDAEVLHALWDIGTYFHCLFNAYPYDYVGGPKRSGKTKSLTLSRMIAFNAISSGNISTASIYRLIQNGACTILIDETELLAIRNNQNNERAQELRNILLNGYKKGMPVYRVDKVANESLVVQAYEVYSPKRLANIGGIDDVLEDRCIANFILAAKDRKISDTEIYDDDARWPEIRSKCYRLYLDFWHEVQLIYTQLQETSLTARQLEIWKPLLTMARFFDDKSPDLDLYKKVLKLAVESTEAKSAENLTETGDMILIETLAHMVQMPTWQDDYISIKDIKGNMAARFEEEQRWLTNEWVGRRVKNLGLTDKRRLGSARQIRIARETIEDLAGRYGISKAVSSPPSQPSQQTQLATRSDGNDGNDGDSRHEQSPTGGGQ